MYIDFTRTLIFIIFTFSSATLFAQRADLSGKVTAANDGQALAGATVSLANGEDVISYGETTDEYGRYAFDQIEPGRYKLTISYVGYLTYVESGYLVGSGPASNRNFELQLNPDPTMEAVEVTAARNISVVNPLKRQVKLEEVRRLPATFYDPARLLALSPGVAQTNDQANHLSVRGNSPNRNLWRLQGLAIVNPNHTANAGTINDLPTLSGGGVNALSAQLLDNSTFYSGGLPAAYGNATGGTFDMRLRPGNTERRQHQVQAGFIGFDLATEGPFAKGKPNSGSYLVNYRYSFTGLLADMGVDFGGEEIRFQDFSAHLFQPVGERGELSVFGIYGASSNEFEGKDEDIEEEKELLDIDYESDLSIAGLTYDQYLGNGKLSFGAAYSETDNNRKQTLRAGDISPLNRRDMLFQSRLNSRIDYTLSTKWLAEIIGGVEYLNERVEAGPRFFTDDGNISYDQSVLSPYLSARHRSGNLGFSLGLRYSLYMDLQNSNVFEPRFALNYYSERSTFSLNAERSSRIHTTGLVSTAGFDFPVQAIPATNQLGLGWQFVFSTEDKLTVNSFYQWTEDDYSLQQVINSTEVNQFANDFVGIGTPVPFNRNADTRSYGLEISYERSIRPDSWYYSANLSVFNSEIQKRDGEWVKSRFSRDFIFHGIGGKEWTKINKRNKKRTLGVNLALTLSGGERFYPYDLSFPGLEPQLFENRAAGRTDQLSTYIRPDLRLYRRKFHKKTTTTLSLDIQNLSGIENTAYRYYDQVTEQIEDRKQLGLIPVLSYRIEWR